MKTFETEGQRPISAYNNQYQISKKLKLPSLLTSQNLPKHKRDFSFNKPKTSNVPIKMSKVEQDDLINENKSLREAVSKYKKELMNSQGKVGQYQKELMKKEKIIQDLVDQSQEKDSAYKVNESQLVQQLKNQFRELKHSYEEQTNELNQLKKVQKITKMNELVLENKVLHEQINKVNQKYIEAKEKLMNYDNFVKEISTLKETLSKQDFIILNFKENFKTAQEDIIEKNKEISELTKIAVEKQEIINLLNKKLNYQYQLNDKLTEITKNIENTNQYIAMKKELEAKIYTYKKNLGYYREDIDEKNKRIKEMKEKIALFDFSSIKKGTEQSVIFDLRNKLSNEKEQNRILQEKLKNCDKKIYLSQPMAKQTNIKKNTKPSINIDTNLSNKEEDEDCDFMSDYILNEFIYILTKAFEAKQIDLTAIESTVIPSDLLNLLSSKENYHNVILTVSSNICQILQLEKEKDQFDTLSFMRTFLYNNFVAKNATIEEFKQTFLNSFRDIILYTNEMSETLTKQIRKKMCSKKEQLQNEINIFDENNVGYISFVVLKKIIDNLKLTISNEILEYMIYIMKKDETSIGLKQLNYYNLLSLLTTNSDDAPNTNDESSIIEITNEEYLSKAAEIMQRIAKALKEKGKGIEDYLNSISYKKGDVSVVDLEKVNDILKKEFDINLSSIEIFCFFSKVKYEEENKGNTNEKSLTNTNTQELEIIDYEKLKNELSSIKNKTFADELSLQSKVVNENYEGIIVKDDKDTTKVNPIIEALKGIDYERVIFPYHCKMKLLPKNGKEYERLLDLDLFKKCLKNNNIQCDNSSFIALLVNNEGIYIDGKINIDTLKKCLKQEKVTEENKELNTNNEENFDESDSFRQMQKEIYDDINDNNTNINNKE